MRRLRLRLLERRWGRAFLAVLSCAYGAALWVRRWSYGFRRHHPRSLSSLASSRQPSVVVSVGNLTTGGTGKTTLTAYLIGKYLSDKNLSVCVISRGYKGGDEAKMLETMTGAPQRFSVLTGANRASCADYYLNLSPSRPSGPVVFILDDAHQHFSLKKDFSIVLVDSLDVPNLKSLLPLGLLREPVSWGLERADAVVVTYADLATPAALDSLERILRSYRPDIPVFYAAHEPWGIAPVADLGRTVPASALEGRPLVLVSGVGNPWAFEETVKKNLKGHVVRHFIFEDHYRYRLSDWRQVLEFSRASGSAPVLTTAKDAMRLLSFPDGLVPGAGDIWALQIRLRLLGREDKFLAMLPLMRSSEPRLVKSEQR